MALEDSTITSQDEVISIKLTSWILIFGFYEKKTQLVRIKFIKKIKIDGICQTSCERFEPVVEVISIKLTIGASNFVERHSSLVIRTNFLHSLARHVQREFKYWLPTPQRVIRITKVAIVNFQITLNVPNGFWWFLFLKKP